MQRKTVVLMTLAVLLTTAAGLALWAATAEANVDTLELTDVQAQAREYVGYYQSIELTAEQEAVKREALEAIPAPCCSDNTAYTCCCPCNMAKTIWGLSNWLIAEKDYDAEQVRAAVQDWVAFINPSGYAGNTCATGRCNLPWKHEGCGGMGAELIF